MKQEMQAINNLFKDAKSRNILIILGVFILIGVVFGIFTITRVQKKSAEAMVPTSVKTENLPYLKTTPGSSTSPKYNEMVEESNRLKSEAAQKNKDTFLPTISNKDESEKKLNEKNPFDLIDNKEEKKEPEESRTGLNPQPYRPPITPTPVVIEPPRPITPPIVIPPPQPQPVQPEIVKVQSKYSEQDMFLIDLLQSIHFSGNKKMPVTETVGGINIQKNNPSTATSPTNPDESKNKSEKPKIRAGTILNAVLESEINSKEPSPVLAKIISGDLAGARLIGKMMTTGEKVYVEFTKITIPRYDRSLSINAVAIDYNSGNKRTALASDVDHHYFRRYALTMAAAFLSGWGTAISRQNTTTSVNPDTGTIITTTGELSDSDINKQALGEVGREISNELKRNSSDSKPTVYVFANEPIGILFMDDWYVKENEGK